MTRRGKREGKNSSDEEHGADRTDGPKYRLARLSSGWIVLAICAASLLVFSNSLAGDFVFDDIDQIVQNQTIRSWDNLPHAFTTRVWAFRDASDPGIPPPLPYYRPLFTAALTVEYHLFGLWPQGWHLFSILLHILCAIEVFWVLLLISERRIVAAASALLFAVHPVHAESVCWISGMTDPLYAVTYLGALYHYIKWRGLARDAQGGRKRFARLSLSVALFLASAFSKETALSLVPLIIGYELIFSTGGFRFRLRQAVVGALPYIGASLVYLFPRYLVLGSETFSNPQAVERPLSYTLFTLPNVIASYLLHLAIPLQLSVTYATHFVTAASSREFLLPVLFLAIIGSALVILRKRLGRGIWFGLLLLVVPLMPVLRLGQVSQEAYLVFDHYLYLSVAGWSLIALEIVYWALRMAPRSSALVVTAAFTLILIAYGALAVRANTAWENSYTLWSNAARIRPGYWAAHYNEGLALLDLRRFVEARGSLETAARLKPDEAVVFAALGRADDGGGDEPGAVAAFQRAIDIDGDLFEAYNDLGTVYFHSQDYAAAEKCFVRALQIRPAAVASRYNLGLCYARLGRWEDSARHLALVAESSPDDAETSYELGLVYERMGRLEQARTLLAKGLRGSKSEELSERISEALSRIGDSR